METVKILVQKDDGTLEQKDSGVRKDLVENFQELLPKLGEPYSVTPYMFDTNGDIVFGIIEKNDKGQQSLVYKLKICKHT